jgi:hypothetical protein
MGPVLVAGGQAAVHRALIVAAAARHRLPAVYPFRYYVASVAGNYDLTTRSRPDSLLRACPLTPFQHPIRP